MCSAAVRMSAPLTDFRNLTELAPPGKQRTPWHSLHNALTAIGSPELLHLPPAPELADLTRSGTEGRKKKEGEKGEKGVSGREFAITHRNKSPLTLFVVVVRRRRRRLGKCLFWILHTIQLYIQYRLVYI